MHDPFWRANFRIRRWFVVRTAGGLWTAGGLQDSGGVAAWRGGLLVSTDAGGVALVSTDADVLQELATGCLMLAIHAS